MKRPVMWAAIAFAVGVGIAAVTPLRVWPIAMAIAATGILATALARRERRLFAVGMAALFVAAGMLRWDVAGLDAIGDPLSDWIESESPQSVTVEAVVRQARLFGPGEDYLQCVADVRSVEYRGLSRTVSGRTLIRWNGAQQPLFAGDTIRVQGQPTVALGPVNWNVFSVEDYWRRRGVQSAIQTQGDAGVEILEKGSPYSPMNAAGRFRHALAQRLADAVPDHTRGFIFAVWLGDRSDLNQDEYDAFIRSGTAHILAVSGVHTGIVFVTASFVVGWFIRVPRNRALFIMLAVGVFALAAGARIATVRAAIMVAVYILADVFDRERDAPTALSIAGLGFLLWDPSLLLDGGAQLSFLSVGSILVFGDRLVDRLKPAPLPVPVKQTVATTLTVQLLPFPVAAGMFHLIPRLAPLANLIVVPLLGVVLWLCLITSILVFISPPLASLFGHAAGGVVMMVQWVAESIASFRFSAQPMTKPTVIGAALYWVALGTLLLRRKMRRRTRYAASVGLFVLAFLLWRPLAMPSQVRFLDVGHGDATVVRSANGKIALVDGGDRSEFIDMGRQVVVPTLASMGESKVDIMFVTHSDRDHIGGLISVVDRLPVGLVVMGPPDPGNEVEEEFLAMCAERRVPVVRASEGDRFGAGEAIFHVLHPPADWGPERERNDLSLVLALDWRGPDLLLPGDIELDAERRLIRSDIAAPLLKAPHHGSNSSSTRPFIDAVAPEAVFISGGARRRLSDPEAVRRRYEAAGVDIWRTSLAGGIRLVAGPEGVAIAGARVARGYPGASAPAP